MKKLVLNLRKIHRVLTIPIVILMVLKGIMSNTDYGYIVTKVVSMGMMFMAITGLIIYLHTMAMKKKKRINKVINSEM